MFNKLIINRNINFSFFHIKTIINWLIEKQTKFDKSRSLIPENCNN